MDHNTLLIYTSVGVTASAINCTFVYSIDPSNPIQQDLVVITGISTHFEGYFRIMHAKPESYIGPINVFYIETARELDIGIACPKWYMQNIEYTSIAKDISLISDIKYKCRPCSDNYYSTSHTDFSVSYHTSKNNSILHFARTDRTIDKCTVCPYGAICTGNNVLPRPNYWGFWYKGKLVFKQCPAGYCCSGSDSNTCNMYCPGNRTGTLCGSCQAGFSVSILTGACTSDIKCGGEQWFGILALLSTTAYALWYTIKDHIFVLLYKTISSFKKLCTQKNNGTLEGVEGVIGTFSFLPKKSPLNTDVWPPP